MCFCLTTCFCVAAPAGSWPAAGPQGQQPPGPYGQQHGYQVLSSHARMCVCLCVCVCVCSWYNSFFMLCSASQNFVHATSEDNPFIWCRGRVQICGLVLALIHVYTYICLWFFCQIVCILWMILNLYVCSRKTEVALLLRSAYAHTNSDKISVCLQGAWDATQQGQYPQQGQYNAQAPAQQYPGYGAPAPARMGNPLLDMYMIETPLKACMIMAYNYSVAPVYHHSNNTWGFPCNKRMLLH